MRILYVLPYLPSLIRSRSYNFIRELARRHEVTLLATDSARGMAEADGMQELCRDIHLVPLRLPSALRSCAAAAVRGDPLQAFFCQSPQLDRKMKELTTRGHFDLVHIEHLRAARLSTLLPAAIPTVYDSVDCISLLLERTLISSHSLRQRLLAALELRRCRAYEAYLLTRFDRTLVNSTDDQRALTALAPNARVDVISNGVDLDYFRPWGGDREPATLVFSGKMSYHANVTALLHFVRQIFPLVRRSRPEVRLLVIGSGPPAAVRNLARDPAISVTGYLPDIRDALGRSTIALCPVTVKVGIQNKILEAMAMGIPVVSTAEGALGLPAEPGHDLLVAGSAAEFADHVCRLLSDPSLREQIGQAGRRYVETNHRWQDATRRLESIYAEAIDGRVREPSGAPSVGSPGGRLKLGARPE